MKTPENLTSCKTVWPVPLIEALPFEDAQACVLGKTAPLDSEEVALEQAYGRVLAADVRANRDLPPYDVSTMDGYALCATGTISIMETFQVIGEIKAGDTPQTSLQPSQCVRIMTGARLPVGAYAVVRVEDVRQRADSVIEVLVPVISGTNTLLRAKNMRQGDIVLNIGDEITPSEVNVLATVKQAVVKVQRKPRVSILSSGNELEGLHEPFNSNKIPDSNSYALMAQVQALGIEPILLGIARDVPSELARLLDRGLEYDVLLVSGGTCVGVHDHTRSTLETLGVTTHFGRVEMRPGHTMAFGTSNRTFVFCLPGNPISSMVCFEQFVLPALRNLMGHRHLFRDTMTARLTHAIKSKQGCVEFICTMLSRDISGNYTVTPVAFQSSSDALSMTRVDALLVLPRECKSLAANEIVKVQLLKTQQILPVANAHLFSASPVEANASLHGGRMRAKE